MTINIDRMPEEAHRFLHLPDLEKIYPATFDAMKTRICVATVEFDVEALLNCRLPGGITALEGRVKSFRAGFAGVGYSSMYDKDRNDKDSQS